MKSCKKLIEVALPLEKINAAATREKSIRHGHPSTLHLWWARRPLAAARAVIWASLVDDPSARPEEFPTEEEQDKERKRLFDILERLVVWENSNNPEVLEEAKVEIAKSTNNNPPPLLDPFAGGGSIPLEAQRLGLEAHAHDLNPVAVMINKAMIEIPPQFANMPPVNPKSKRLVKNWSGAEGLAEDVKYYGEMLRKMAFERIGHLYPQVELRQDSDIADNIDCVNGQSQRLVDVVAWIWTRTIKCPNPACGCEVPLTRRFILSKNRNSHAQINPLYQNESLYFKVNMNSCDNSSAIKSGARSGIICTRCNEIIPSEYIKREGVENKYDSRLMAIVAKEKSGRLYISPDHNQEIIADVPLPDHTPDANISRNPRWFSPPLYGLTTYSSLFSNRQLTMLNCLCDIITEIKKQVDNDTGNSKGFQSFNQSRPLYSYSDAITTYLSFIVDKMIDRHSTLCAWDSSRDGISHTFTRQALPMIWDYAEGNPFSDASGSINNSINWIIKCIKNFPIADKPGKAEQINAQNAPAFSGFMVSTDPPYYDNIGYADLSDYFYIWLRYNLKDIYPTLFKTLLVPKSEELIASPYRFNGDTNKAKEFFENGMIRTCQVLYDCSRNDIPVTIHYAYKQEEKSKDQSHKTSKGWETMLTAIIKSGFSITGTWPMRTELKNRQVAQNTNALECSIILVCRKRDHNAITITRRDLIKELKSELRPALSKLQSANIAPVDMAQSAIGPGMAVFSRYKEVLGSDGTPMTVRDALQIINQELDAYFNEQSGSLDRGSQFCVDLYSQFAFDEVKYGDADTLARAKNISVEMLKGYGVLFAQKGVVRLLKRSELAKQTKENEECLWLIAQQLTREFEEGGVEKCAELVAFFRSSSKVERAKDLVYRLYTIANDKGWTSDAFSYNSLVVSWSEIKARAGQIEAEKAKRVLFDKEN